MLPITLRTQTAPKQLRDSLRRVQQQGYAVCDRMLDNQLRSVAVPVRDGLGRVVAAMVAFIAVELRRDEGLSSTALRALGSAAKVAGQRWS